MKKILLSLVTFVLFSFTYAQNQDALKPVARQVQTLYAAKAQFNNQNIFYVDDATAQRSIQASGDIKTATVMKINKQALISISSNKPEYLRITIPAVEGTISVDLYKVNIFTDDFSVVTASNNQPFSYNAGVHYRGIVNGNNNSLVAISVFNDEVMGFVSMNNKNYVLGKIDHDVDGNHIFYDQRNLNASPSTGCYTVDDGEGYTAAQTAPLNGMETVKCVRLYWEVNYDIYQGKGSVTAATNYVTAVFNQSSTIYSNDGISVTLSQVYVWDIASPYTGTTTSNLLAQFKSYRNSINGDLANLLGYAGGGGVAAGFAGLCASNLDNSMCYSGISSGYNNYPTYSWTVMVVTHEQGHLLGSRHTHACVWNGNNTAIDGCSGATEGGCPLPGNPVGGGTIMSYCHQTSVGINFTLGFGPQPQTIIVNDINNASCLTACSGGGCGVPGGLAASNITTTTATVSWSAVNGATSYNFQYKATSSGTWIPVNGLTATTTNLTGLTVGTSYDCQVAAVCSTGSSGYSTTTSFVTLAGACADNYEPNNTTSAAKVITAGTLTGKISPSGDFDWFKFANSASTPNIKVTLTNLPADYDLKLLRGTTLLVTSSHGGTTNEQAVYNTTVVASNYKIKVIGYAGANNATLCYTLTTLLSASAFSPAALPGDGGVNADLKPITDDETGIAVYPNPASEILNIMIPASASQTEIQLIDRLGKIVRSFTQNNSTMDNNIQMDLHDLSNGMYMIHIVQDGNMLTQKVVVNK